MGIIDLSKLGPAQIAHGWIFIGLVFDILLLGVMLSQVYLYYVTYKHDKLWIKVFVAGLLLADVLKTVLDVAYMYRTLIIQFGNVNGLANADWLFACDPALTAVIAMSCQLFFAWRVYVLTKTPVWAGIISFVALMGGVAGLVTAVQVVRVAKFVEFQKFKQVVVIWLASEVTGDLFITSILVLYLVSMKHPRKHKTGFPSSDLIVDKIIRVSVQTGMITMFVATFDIAFYLSDPSGLHLMFNFPLCKIYSNCLMSSLNSRRGWKFGSSASGDSQGQAPSSGNVTLKNRHTQLVSGKNNEILSSLDQGNPAAVYVHVESHELRDMAGAAASWDDKKADSSLP